MWINDIIITQLYYINIMQVIPQALGKFDEISPDIDCDFPQISIIEK